MHPLVVDLMYLSRTSGLDRSEAVSQAAASAAARSSARASTVSGTVMVKRPSRSSSQRALMTGQADDAPGARLEAQQRHFRASTRTAAALMI